LGSYIALLTRNRNSALYNLGWLACSGWLTHISGHPSSAGRAQDSESKPARDRRSTDWTVQPTRV